MEQDREKQQKTLELLIYFTKWFKIFTEYLCYYSCHSVIIWYCGIEIKSNGTFCCVFIHILCHVKVGVNHGIFHIYHFWNFLIFKCTWVYSSSSSKNKHIFLNLSINSINSKMSIYLSISKMCSSLFSRGNQAFARIAYAKRTTQSRDATLSAITDIDYQSPLCTMCTCIRVSLFGKHWSKTGPKSDFIR